MPSFILSKDSTPSSSELWRHEIGRCDDTDFGAEFAQQVNIRSRHAAMAISPQIATVKTFGSFLCRSIDKASSKACVGCSCLPSPALMTEAFICGAMDFGMPYSAWRMTSASMPIASRSEHRIQKGFALLGRAVLDGIFTTSAPRRLAAISNEVRVRSRAQKRLTIVLPLSFEDFFSAGGLFAYVAERLRMARYRRPKGFRYQADGVAAESELGQLARNYNDDTGRLTTLDIKCEYGPMKRKKPHRNRRRIRKSGSTAGSGGIFLRSRMANCKSSAHRAGALGWQAGADFGAPCCRAAISVCRHMR